MRFARLLRSIVVAGVVAAAACGSKGKSQDAGGIDGGAGSGGPAGAGGGGGDAAGGAGGAGAGKGGTSGTGGAPITTCPAVRPTFSVPCSGTFNCTYQVCSCHGCCDDLWNCVSGYLMGTDFNNTCSLGPPCPDGGAVCTFGADQTCNDSPLISSIHGHCTDAGVCECTFGGGLNPDSGRCL